MDSNERYTDCQGRRIQEGNECWMPTGSPVTIKRLVPLTQDSRGVAVVSYHDTTKARIQCNDLMLAEEEQR